MLTIRRASESDIQEWNEFVYSSPAGTIFHSREWSDIHRRTFNATTIDLVACENGKMVGVFSFNLVSRSLPGLQRIGSPIWFKKIRSPPGVFENPYGGPVCSPDRPDVFRFLILEALRLATPFGKASISTSPNVGGNQSISEGIHFQGSRIFWKETLLLDLKAPLKDIVARFDSNVRANIRRSEKLGVKVVECESENDIDVYHQILEATYARFGISPFPKQFYKDVFNSFRKLNQVRILFAVYENKPIAGSAYLMDHATVYYWTAGYFRSYSRANGTTLIQGKMIEFAKRNDFRVFDMTGLDNNLPALARFKSSFGGELCRFPTMEWNSPALNRIVETMRYLSSKRTKPIKDSRLLASLIRIMIK